MERESYGDEIPISVVEFTEENTAPEKAPVDKKSAESDS